MKRIVVIIMAVVAASFMPATASAQFNISNALNALFGGSKKTEQQVEQKSPYQLIAEAAPTAREIVGTWTYDSSDAEYLGSNQLANLAISQVKGVALSKLESYGITKGSFKVQIRRNGTGTITMGDKTLSGNYDYNPTPGAILFTGKVNGVSLSCNGFLKMKSGKLVVMVDADDAISAFKQAYPEYANHQLIQTLGGVLASFSEIYGAIYLTR